MKTALALEQLLAPEERTAYHPSLKEGRNIVAQRIPGTINLGKPFSVVTPQREVGRVDLPNRMDQGPPPIISHDPMQEDQDDRFPFDESARPIDKVRSLEPFKFPAFPAPAASFQTLRVWEGVIVRVDGPKFKAVLTDVQDPRFGKEAGEFYVTEVSEEDRGLVEPGAVFYWYVGVEITKSRTLKEVSALRFRRLPAWSAQQVKSVEKEAARLEALFGRTGRNSSSAGD